MQAPVVQPLDVPRDRDLEVVDALPSTLIADQLGVKNELNVSAGALSYESPVDLTDAIAPTSARRWV
ncbi:hypothetical protein GCM10009756_00560 [Pseudokineococcus marinus]